MNTFAEFKKFDNKEEAEALAERLLGLGIMTEIEDNTSSVNSTFTGAAASTEVVVKIMQSDFEKANKLMEEEAAKLLAAIDKDYYLYEFSDEELYDILLHRDDWGDLDTVLAKKILKERGKEVDESLVEALRKQRFDDLAKTEDSPKVWIVAGYVLAILGGFLGVFLGWHIWKSINTIPDGRRVYQYKKEDRSHGRNIVVIGTIVFALAFLARFMELY